MEYEWIGNEVSIRRVEGENRDVSARNILKSWHKGVEIILVQDNAQLLPAATNRDTVLPLQHSSHRVTTTRIYPPETNWLIIALAWSIANWFDPEHARSTTKLDPLLVKNVRAILITSKSYPPFFSTYYAASCPFPETFITKRLEMRNWIYIFLHFLTKNIKMTIFFIYFFINKDVTFYLICNDGFEICSRSSSKINFKENHAYLMVTKIRTLRIIT